MTSSGEVVLQPKEKLAIFQNFNIECLYESSNPSEINMDSFLSKLHIPGMLESHRQNLSNPITIQEVERAINKLKLGKAPGREGLSGEF